MDAASVCGGINTEEGAFKHGEMGGALTWSGYASKDACCLLCGHYWHWCRSDLFSA